MRGDPSLCIALVRSNVQSKILFKRNGIFNTKEFAKGSFLLEYVRERISVKENSLACFLSSRRLIAKYFTTIHLCNPFSAGSVRICKLCDHNIFPLFLLFIIIFKGHAP